MFLENSLLNLSHQSLINHSFEVELNRYSDSIRGILPIVSKLQYIALWILQWTITYFIKASIQNEGTPCIAKYELEWVCVCN